MTVVQGSPPYRVRARLCAGMTVVQGSPPYRVRARLCAGMTVVQGSPPYRVRARLCAGMTVVQGSPPYRVRARLCAGMTVVQGSPPYRVRARLCAGTTIVQRVSPVSSTGQALRGNDDCGCKVHSNDGVMFVAIRRCGAWRIRRGRSLLGCSRPGWSRGLGRRCRRGGGGLGWRLACRGWPRR